MDRDWQYLKNGTVPNPTDAAHGPQLYDNHLYFNFGGVAAQDPDSYMRVICNYTGITKETAIGDAPIVTGAFTASSLVVMFLAASAKLRLTFLQLRTVWWQPSGPSLPHFLQMIPSSDTGETHKSLHTLKAQDGCSGTGKSIQTLKSRNRRCGAIAMLLLVGLSRQSQTNILTRTFVRRTFRAEAESGTCFVSVGRGSHYHYKLTLPLVHFSGI